METSRSFLLDDVFLTSCRELIVVTTEYQIYCTGQGHVTWVGGATLGGGHMSTISSPCGLHDVCLLGTNFVIGHEHVLTFQGQGGW